MPNVSIDLSELSGVTPGADNLKNATVWFYPYRPYEDDGSLVTTDKLVVSLTLGVGTTFLPETPDANGMWVEIRNVRLPSDSRKFVVAIPGTDCNLFDLDHLDPDSLDPLVPPSPAWVSQLAAEVTRATGAEQTNATAIAVETTRATGVEATKVSTSTYTAGLALKQDAASLSADAAPHVSDGTALDLAVTAKIATVGDAAYASRVGLQKSVARQFDATGLFDLTNAYAVNVATPLVTPTYDASGQATHPSVQFYPAGWNGYRYWMAMTPYPGGVDTTENPSIIASNDGDTWVVPAGLTNPIDTPTSGFYPDPDLIDIDGTLWCTYAASKAKFSTDGITWSARQSMTGGNTGAGAAGYVSQTVVRHGDEIWYWAVDSAPAINELNFHNSASGSVVGPYSAKTLCTIANMPATRDIWHLQIRKSGDLFVGIFTLCDRGTSGNNATIRLATSSDGLAWTMQTTDLLAKNPGGWDDYTIYRSAIVPRGGVDGVLFDLFYAGLKQAGSIWHIGRTPIKAGTSRIGVTRTDTINKSVTGQTVIGPSGKNLFPNPSLLHAVTGAIVPTGATNNLTGATGHAWSETEEDFSWTSTKGSAGSQGNMLFDIAGTYTAGDVWSFSFDTRQDDPTVGTTSVSITWLDAGGSAIGSATVGTAVSSSTFARAYAISTVPALAVKARCAMGVSFLVAGTTKWHVRRAQLEKAPAPTTWEPAIAKVGRAVVGQTANIEEWHTALDVGKGARVGFAVGASGRPRAEVLSATPTDAAVPGELCIVSGIVYICTAAGTPGTWAKVGPITKTDLSLGNVDNTSDANKPVSTATQAALTAAAGGLTTGQMVPPRDLMNSNTQSHTSGTLAIVYFTADKTETISTLTNYTGTVAAAATPTLCRMGIYSIAPSGDGTMVASTPNDTTLFAAANTAYAKGLSSSFSKVAGQRYGAATLVVSGATMPNFHGCALTVTTVNSAVQLLAPSNIGRITGQTDLPATFTSASVIGYQQRSHMLLS